VNSWPSIASTRTQMAVVRVENAGRYGTVETDSDGRVVKFAEKTGGGAPGLINGGIYVFSEPVWQHIPDGPSSLEKDVFPRLLDQGLYAQEQHGMFIDIGTPADYARAQHLLRSV
jgi:NDP-sugar pyrophosphorylase family protein